MSTEAMDPLGPAKGGPPTVTARLGVVVVDGRDPALTHVSRKLCREGFDILATCTTGQDALDYIAHYPVDVVVLNLPWPDPAGLAVIEQVHQLSPGTRVVLGGEPSGEGSAADGGDLPGRAFAVVGASSGDLGRLLRRAADDMTGDSDVHAGTVKQQRAVSLSRQEDAVLAAVAEGLTNRQIGARLGLSHYTVKDHVTNVMRKLGTRRRAEAVLKASQHGLLHLAPSTTSSARR